MLNLTKLENQVLRVFYNTSVDCCGSCNEYENISYCNANDIATELNLNENQVGGILASLLKKNLISDTHESARGADINDFVLCNIEVMNQFEKEDNL